MQYKYLKDFTKTSVDDMEVVQEVISNVRVVIDSKFFPLLEEAEKGGFEVMAEVYEMFAFGNHGVKPNFELAHRYCIKLHEVGLKSNSKELIAEGLNNLAYLYHNFGRKQEAHDAFFKAFKYMVANLEPQEWDTQIVNLVTEYINGFEESDIV